MAGVSVQSSPSFFQLSSLNPEAPVLNGATSAAIAVSALVVACSLPIIGPIAKATTEIAIRVVVSPLVLIHRLVVLNYTILSHHPSYLLNTILLANFYFLYGFLFSQFLPTYTTSGFYITEWNNEAQRSFAQMLLVCLQGDNPSPSQVVRRIEERTVHFPNIFSCDLDLVIYNNERLELAYAPPPVEIQEPKFASLRLKCDYFHNRAPNLEIPPLPPGTNLHDQITALWNQIYALDQRDLEIDDENYQFQVRHDFVPDRARYYAINHDSPSYRALCHVVLHLLERKRLIDQMAQSQKKEKAKNEWLRDSRSFIMSLIVTGRHCVDRHVTDAYIYYLRYVKRKPITLDSFENSRLENSIFELLAEYRQDLVQHACTNCIETNMHHVSTERYVKGALNEELGLGFPQELGQVHYQNLAIGEKVDEVRRIFYQLYTPQSIVRYFIRKTHEQMQGQENHVLYMKIVEWFERQDPPKQAADIFDPDTLSFSEDAIIELFKKHRIIE
jgi:hypothetical protein